MTVTMANDRRYFAADAELDDERARLRLLEQVHDPATIRKLMRISVDEGWRCLEVGAGGGSIARWLAERVGPNGHVVATDIDLRFLDYLDLPNVEVRRHDIVKEPVEEGAYDFVHCRALLNHISDPEAVASTMVRALRPGGWLLAEEADYMTFAPVDDAHPLAAGITVVWRKRYDYAVSAGISNPFFGRLLPRLVARLGLTECGNETSSQVVQGGSPAALFAEKSAQRLDRVMLDKGLVTAEEIADRGKAFADPTLWFVDVMVVSAWGRLPV